MTRPLVWRCVAGAWLALAVVACGGGGGSSGGTPSSLAVTPATPATSAAVSEPRSGMATFRLAAPSAAQSARRDRSVSWATRGIAFSITPAGGSAGAPVLFSLASGSALCTANADGSRNCAFSVPVPVGASSAAITTYDAPPAGPGTPAGNVLATARVPVTLPAGGSTVVPLTLNNVVASASLTLVSRPQLGASGIATYSVNAIDPAGATIVGGDPFANPIGVTLTDTTGAVTLTSGATIASPTSAVTLAYSGAIMRAPAQIALTVSPVAGAPSPAASTSPMLFVPAGPGPDVGRSVAFVAAGTQTVTIPSPLPSVVVSPSSLTGSLQYIPSPGPTAIGAQSVVQIFATAAPTIAGTAIPATIAARTFFPSTNPAQTQNASIDYLDFVNDGSRVNLVRYASTSNVTNAYTNGTYSITASTVFNRPVIVARMPLTAGDSWSTPFGRTVTTAFTDTRSFIFYSSQQRTSVYNDDNSSTTTIKAFITSPFFLFGSNGKAVASCTDTFTFVRRADGSYLETDVYSPCNGDYTEIDSISAPGPDGTGTYTATFSGNFPPTTTPVSLPWKTYASRAASDTVSVSGPAALDPACAMTSPSSGAYVLTEGVNLGVDDYLATTTSVNKSYVVPGLGPICTLTSTTRTQNGAQVNLTDLSGSIFLFEGTTFSTPVYTQTQQLAKVQQLPPVTMSAARRTSDVGDTSVPGNPDVVAAQRDAAYVEAKGRAHHSKTTFTGANY